MGLFRKSKSSELEVTKEELDNKIMELESKLEKLKPMKNNTWKTKEDFEN